jgi:NADH dehydrogenase [ubiquinone] 1 alpha subcomplex assembly factor 1
MKILLLIILSINMLSSQTLIYDFTTPESSGEWYIVNDDVMGGVSNSQISFNPEGSMTFRGNLSPENFGGFASIRSPLNIDRDQEFSGVIIKMKGDGNIYSLRFRTSDAFDGYAYQAKVKTLEDEWQEFKVPFEDFKATFRGRTLWNKPALQSKNLAQIGILIADKQFGQFETQIEWIKLY